MHRISAVSATALLSGAALTAGAGAAQASVPAHHAPAHHATSRPAPSRHAQAHLVGLMVLKRVDASSHRQHTGELLCSVSTAHDGPTTIKGYGDLKDPTTACVELTAVNGEFDRLRVHPTWLSPAIVAPVKVEARGTWKGTKVAWSHEYSNSGQLAKTTGDVFEF